MFSRLRSYRPSHTTVVAYLALFLVLTGGTAVALDGSNTVFSDDITNGEVTNSDVALNSIGGGRIADGSLGPGEIVPDSLNAGRLAPNAVAGSELAGNAVTGAKVADNSLTGADVDENTLATVPTARELGIRGSDDFPTRVGSGQFGAADLQWDAEFLDTNTAADHSYPSVILKTTGTAGQFRVCEIPGAGVVEFTIYVNGTRTQHNTIGTGGCASTTFDPGNRGDFEILARRTRIMGWDHSSLADAEDYTTYALVGPFS
jgi:hypothetical protein